MGVAHEKTSLKHQPHVFLMTMRQYWLGKTKPRQQIDLKRFQQVAIDFFT